MGFRKDMLAVKRKRMIFGKNIIITDNVDWTTLEIVEASLDRWQVETQFRISKDDDLVCMASYPALDRQQNTVSPVQLYCCYDLFATDRVKA